MRREPQWGPLVQGDVERLPYKVAERACIAAVTFAKDGSGEINVVRHGLPRTLRLRVPGAVVLLTADAKSINVLRILRAE
jgi:hypothetical protein